MQAIREWGRRNPDKLAALLDENPSYVFFREVPPPAPGTLEAQIDGPFGTLGVPLLRERAIAVDPRSIPLGAPVYPRDDVSAVDAAARRGSCSRRTPAARSAARCARTSSGASATMPGVKPGG